MAALWQAARESPGPGWPLVNLKEALVAQAGAAVASVILGEFLQATVSVKGGFSHLGRLADLVPGAAKRVIHATAQTISLSGSALPGGRRSPATALQARALFAVQLERAMVFGRSNLRERAGGVLADHQGDETARYATRWGFDPLVVAGEMGPGGPHVHWLCPQAPVLQLPEAIGLAGVFSPGWGHCVLEFAPQLLLANLPGGPDPDVPVIVDSGLPETHYQMLAHVAGGRRLIRLPALQAAQAERLWLASAPEFWPVLRAPGQVFRAGLSSMNPDALAALLAHAPAPPRNPALPARVFLARSGRHVRLADQAGVADRLARAGFVTVAPESLSLPNQLALVAQATHVAGAAGSQILLAMMFGRPDLAVLMFHHPKLEETPALTATAEARGQRVLVLPGQTITDNATMPYNETYAIDAGALDAALEEWL
jgi:hypothetical protein